ncbi:MAG TPA: riboflavin synthase [Armatimonadota bacterium]|jgi:riboflavin synthase
MFTGIIEEVGTVRAIEPRGEALALRVEARTVLEDARPACSIAVDGVCLTVVDVTEDTVAFDVIPETLSKTALGALRPGSPVNLERAMRVGDRLGGHFVQGHVDGVGTVTEVLTEGEWYMIRFHAPDIVARYLIPHGSISVNGVSLTVARMEGDSFMVGLIPHTLENTDLGSMKPGDTVNLEADMLGKYVDALLASGGRGADVRLPGLSPEVEA